MNWSDWSREQAHASLRAWWPAAGFDSAGQPYLTLLRQAYGGHSRRKTLTPTKYELD